MMDDSSLLSAAHSNFQFNSIFYDIRFATAADTLSAYVVARFAQLPSEQEAKIPVPFSFTNLCGGGDGDFL